MKEPKIYQAHDRRGQYTVVWHSDEGRKRKTFSDGAEAELFRKKKLFEHLGPMMLKDITTYERYVPVPKVVPAGRTADLESENVRLRDQLAALAKQLREEQTRRNEKPSGAKLAGAVGQSINLRAFWWAYEQDDLSVTAKTTLVTFAIHSNHHGYSWPGAERIADTWGMDRETVRRQIAELLANRKIFRTKKRCGVTGQVKVYRLPKNTYESGGKSHPFENDESAGKARDKRRTSGGKSSTNKEQGNKKSAVVADESSRLAVMEAATTATDCLDLVNKLQLQFPDHNVAYEYKRFCNWRDARGLARVPSKFALWMLRAEKPIKQPAVATATPEFSNWFARAYPEKTSSPAWAEAPDWLKDEFRRWEKTGAMPTPAQA